jgi:type I restriction enzyme S subunit
MCSEWQTHTVGDFLTLEYGKPLDKKDRKVDGLYPAYGANGIKARSDKYLCESKAIIIGRKGSAGELTITEDRFWPLDVTYFVKFDTAKYDLTFVYYLLSLLSLPDLATGVKPGINRNKVYAIKVKTPSLFEQQRIVAILDQAFADIEKARANAEKNLKNARELFDSYLNQVFSQRGEGWVESELFDHVKFIDYRGKTPKKTQEGLRLITAKNVRMGYLKKTPEEFVARDSYDEWMTRGIPEKGDILFTTEAPLANVAQLDTYEKVVFAQRIITMQPDRSVLDDAFLKYLLMSKPVQERILKKGTGATVTGIKASLLKKIIIEYPFQLSEQRMIVNTLEVLDRKVNKLEVVFSEKLNSLDELKKSLLQKAFSGELTKTEDMVA